MDVRPRALAELRPLAPALDRDRPGRGAEALRRPGRSTLTPRTPRRSRGERNRYGFFGRARDPRVRPVGHGLVALPDPRPRPGRLAPLRRHPLRGRLRRRALGRARGPRLGREPGAGRGRAARSPTATCDRWWSADGGRDRPRRRRCSRSAASSRSTRGCKALQGVDFDVVEGEVHCLLGAQRRRQVDADQVRLGRRRADRGRDPRRAASRCPRAIRRRPSAAASRRSTRSSTWSRTSPSPRASSWPTSRGAGRSSTSSGCAASRRRCSSASATAPSTRGRPCGRCARRPSRSSRSRGRSPTTSGC